MGNGLPCLEYEISLPNMFCSLFTTCVKLILFLPAYETTTKCNNLKISVQVNQLVIGKGVKPKAL